MTILIIGLIIFLGLHSLRVVADPWRTRQVAALGEMRWKGLYSAVSIGSLALVIWGFSLARVGAPVLWVAPMGLHYVTALLVFVSFVLLTAAYVPGTRIKAALGHPMTLGVMIWAVAHLLSAGSLADVLLFGSFLVWAAAVYTAARRRDRAAGTQPPAGRLARDAVVLVISAVAWIALAAGAHQWLFGLRPFA